jgi:hypothetical protein
VGKREARRHLRALLAGGDVRGVHPAVRLGTLRRARAYAQPLGLWTAEHRALLRDAARAVLAEVLVRLGAVYEGET